MATHSKHQDKSAFYFVTFTCYKWLPLFEVTGFYDAIYNWFIYMEGKQKCKVAGYVIMPNHIHLLLYVSDKSPFLNIIIASGKRFLAYEIIKRLKQLNYKDLLKELADGVSENEKIKGKKHQVFRLSFDAKLCEGEKEIEEVLSYIHENPVQRKWSLVKEFTAYRHSSAMFYEEGVNQYHKVTHYREVWDRALQRL